MKENVLSFFMYAKILCVCVVNCVCSGVSENLNTGLYTFYLMPDKKTGACVWIERGIAIAI